MLSKTSFSKFSSGRLYNSFDNHSEKICRGCEISSPKVQKYQRIFPAKQVTSNVPQEILWTQRMQFSQPCQNISAPTSKLIVRLRFFLRRIHLPENVLLGTQNKVSATTPIIFGILPKILCSSPNVSIFLWIVIRRRKNLNIYLSSRRVHFWQSCREKIIKSLFFWPLLIKKHSATLSAIFS